MWALYLGSIRKVGRVVTSINKKQPSIYILFNVYALKDMSVKLFCLFICIKYNVLIIVICIIFMHTLRLMCTSISFYVYMVFIKKYSYYTILLKIMEYLQLSYLILHNCVSYGYFLKFIGHATS